MSIPHIFKKYTDLLGKIQNRFDPVSKNSLDNALPVATSDVQKADDDQTDQLALRGGNPRVARGRGPIKIYRDHDGKPTRKLPKPGNRPLHSSNESTPDKVTPKALQASLNKEGEKTSSKVNLSVTTQSPLLDKALNHSISPSALVTQAPRDLNQAINRININSLSELTEKYKKNKEENEKEEARITQIRGDALPLAVLEAFADPDHDEIEVPWLIGNSSGQQSRHNYKHSHKPSPQSSSDEQRASNEQSTPYQPNTAQTSSGDHTKIAHHQHTEHANTANPHAERATHLSPTEYLQAYLNQARLQPSESIQNVASSPKV